MKKNDIQWAISSPCEKKTDLSQFSLSKALPAINILEVGWGKRDRLDRYETITIENNLALLFFII